MDETLQLVPHTYHSLLESRYFFNIVRSEGSVTATDRTINNGPGTNIYSKDRRNIKDIDEKQTGGVGETFTNSSAPGGTELQNMPCHVHVQIDYSRFHASNIQKLPVLHELPPQKVMQISFQWAACAQATFFTRKQYLIGVEVAVILKIYSPGDGRGCSISGMFNGQYYDKGILWQQIIAKEGRKGITMPHLLDDHNLS